MQVMLFFYLSVSSLTPLPTKFFGGLGCLGINLSICLLSVRPSVCTLYIIDFFSRTTGSISTKLCTNHSGLYINFFFLIATCPFGQVTKTFYCPNFNFTCPKIFQYKRSNIVDLKAGGVKFLHGKTLKNLSFAKPISQLS